MIKWWQYHPIIAPYPLDWVHEEHTRKDAKEWMNMATDHIERLEKALEKITKTAPFGEPQMIARAALEGKDD